MAELRLQLGLKTDPAQYRFSYPWLFRLLAEEGVHHVQLGTFFEMYQLPDEYFVGLRRAAEESGVRIHSVFTAHRELGGFFVDDVGWETVARRSFERLIEIGSLVGARSVGSNPGAVYRDRMQSKRRGLERYLRHMKELMELAHQRGVPWLTIEPMSCLAEPPTLPDEIRGVADELNAWHEERTENTARVGFCTDVAHGYVDRQGAVRYDHLELLEATLPYLYELHLKNTDRQYSSTFGFSPEERREGIIYIEPVRRMLLAGAETLPVAEVVGYLEIGGPKLGRDHSDKQLAGQLRSSLRYLRQAWLGESSAQQPAGATRPRGLPVSPEAGRQRPVRVCPSLMCADPGHLSESVQELERAGADMLHLDMADGHFVPNLLLGLDVVRWLRSQTSLPLDVHLMVDNPDRWIGPLAEIGVDAVAVHAEVCPHLDRTLIEIRESRMAAGVALNPATPLEAVRYVVERLDFVLLMTVNPGFAGGKLVAAGLRKIADCRRLLQAQGLRIPIMVDGNVSFENIPRMVAAGADVLVAGTSSWFHDGAPLSENVEKTNRAIAAGLNSRTRAKGG